jgi:hypothetical protein
MSWIEFHQESERLASAAEEAIRTNRLSDAERLYRDAAEKERAAFGDIEPDKARTRGITAVSVVALAYKGKAFRMAQDFAYAVLREARLPEFAITDIRNLLQTIWTEEAIAAAGVKFSKTDVIVAVRGGEVMTGGAPLDLILRKVEEVRALFYRTVELLMELPLRLRGGPRYEIQQLFRPWLFQAPAGSYQFAVRLESPPQLELGLEARHIPAVEEVTGKFVEILNSAATDPDEALASTVPNPEYRSAFLKLTRNLAPSGKTYAELEIRSQLRPDVGSVVFSADDRKLINQTIKKAIPAVESTEGTDTTFTGILRAVHLDQDWIEVTVRDPTEQHIRIEKAGEAIDDVVGPMINRPVQVDATRTATGRLLFKDIQPIE